MYSDVRTQRRLGVLLRCVGALVVGLIGTSAWAQTAAGGVAHTVVLAADGTVWTVGANTRGQLGDHTTTTRRTPVQVRGLRNIVAVAAGANHTMALTGTGRLYVWGDNANGQVGNGASPRKTPVRSNLRDVIAIAAGAHHSVALRSNGDVYTWGRNTHGQLGNGSTTLSTSPVRVATGVVAVAAGFHHTLFVKNDGAVYATGQNANGQLGDGTTTRRTSPVRMSGIATATKAAGGEKFSVMVLSDGTLVSTGDNRSGQLGDGTTTQRTSPVPVSTLTNVTAIAAGAGHVLALDSGDSVWAWGLNGHGQVGDGTTTNRSTPTELNVASGFSRTDGVASISPLTKIGTGRFHGIAVTLDGVVHTWGRNARSQLGDGTTVDRRSPTPISNPNYDWKVSTPTFSVAAGIYSTEKTVRISIATTGATIRFTRNGNEPTESDPAIASGDRVTVTTSQRLSAKAFKDGMPPSNTASVVYELKVATPTATPGGGTYISPQTVSLLTTSPGTTLRYTTDGSTPSEASTVHAGPIVIGTTTTLNVAGFRPGWTTSVVTTAIYAMNFGTLQPPSITPAAGTYDGQVTVTLSSPQPGATIRYTTDGTPPSASAPAYTGPIVIGSMTTLRATAFHPDYTTSAEASSVYTIAASPPTLSAPSGTYAPGSVVTIATPDAAATLRMTLDGTDPTAGSPVVASGTSIFIGTFTLRLRAFKAGTTDSAVASGTYALTTALGAGAIAAGAAHTVLATPDGQVYAWGLNSAGQLGEGTVTTRLAPTLVQTVTGVTSLAAGQAHTLARTWDGQVYAWGANDAGQVGDGTTIVRDRPVHVSVLTNVVAVAAGDRHSLALTADGRVLAWGLGDSGQLGLGASLSQAIPTEVPGLTTIVAIAAGDGYNLAVTGAGQLYAWGANASSTLGDGTTLTRTSPVLVGLSNVAGVAAGASHALALLRGGAVYAWGLGTSGQLGLGAPTLATTPTRVPGLTASAIAASGDHSAAMRADGAFVAWGANASGQVGDGSTANRSVPTVIAGAGSISALALGAAHTSAVSPDGLVSTWGEGSSGQLGDGGTSNQLTPVAVLSTTATWAPAAPVLSLASGTFSGPQVVSLTSAALGADVRYTLTGTDPIETDQAVPVTGVVDIVESAQLRARAFVDGRVPGAIARADYTLQVATPVITPVTGTYASAQTVTLTSGDAAATVRYTLDGTDPTPSSTPYAGPFVVNTAVTITARAFRPGAWLPSESVQVVLQINAIPTAPVASPASGVYPDPVAVALSFLPETTIRYTLDGSVPSAVSNVYVTPLPVTSGTATIKAIAFHLDGTTSEVLTASYTIDIVAPTITARVFPTAINGWHRASPVTVTFTCADAIGIASCPAPATITGEGSGLLATGTAVDRAGRQTALAVTVNLDVTLPTVALTSPVPGLVTSAPTVLLSGQATDLLSGIVAATCNGAAATLVGDQVSCLVPLNPGRNAVVFAARDAAGQSASVGIDVTQVGVVTRLAMAPAERTLLVEETASFSLRDDFDAPVAGATWSASDPSIVSLSVDDPPVMTALAAGTTTVTAIKDGLTATATLTVTVGVLDGTTRWRVTPAPGLTMGSPIYTHRVEDTVPDLFTVERGAGDTTTVRAVHASGDVTWSVTAPLEPLMGDVFGGLVAATLDARGDYTGYVRYAGPASAPPWRYESRGWVGQPAQAPDGTIYTLESHRVGTNTDGRARYDAWVIVLDGATGQLRQRVPLTPEVFVFEAALDGRVLSPSLTCRSTREERFPAVLGPLVGDDGSGYVVVRQWVRVEQNTCLAGQSGAAIAVDTGLTLLRLSPAGVVQTTVLLGPHDPTPAAPTQLLPDGLGGVLVSYTHQASLRTTRLDAVGQRTDLPGFGTVRLIGAGGTAYGDGGPTLDVTTGAVLWSNTRGFPVAALAGGGLAVSDFYTGALIALDATGAPVGSLPLNLDAPVQTRFGIWTGLDYAGPTPTLAARVSLPLNEASTSYMERLVGAGNAQGNKASHVAGYPTIDEAARGALDFIWDLTSRTPWEWGGVVCRQAQRYWWSPIVTNHDSGSVITLDSFGLTDAQRQALPRCVPYGEPQPVAAFHTHVVNGGQPYPSGFGTPTTVGTDLGNASQRPDMVYFVKTPNASAGGTSQFTFKYQAVTTPDSQGNPVRDVSGNVVWSAYYNTFKWVDGQWHLFSPPPQ